MSKDVGLEAAEKKVSSFPQYNVTIASGGAVLKAAAVCAVERWDSILASFSQNPFSPTQCSRYSWHLWDTSCLFCWNVLPRCLAVCVALSNEVNQSISSVLLSLLWPLPTVLVHWYERPCHAAHVPVSAEVYMCSPPSLPKVYREKLDFPGQLRWPNSS